MDYSYNLISWLVICIDDDCSIHSMVITLILQKKENSNLNQNYAQTNNLKSL